jgi:hypothetical protein
MIIQELVTTEEHYVRDLDALCSVYVDPLDPKLDPIVHRLSLSGGPNTGGPDSPEKIPSPSKRRTLSIMGKRKSHNSEDFDRASNHHILSPEDHSSVFANAKEILNLHKYFLEERFTSLKPLIQPSTSEESLREAVYELGALFLKFAPKLQMYSAFVSTYTDRLGLLKRLGQKSKKWNKYLARARGVPQCRKLSLSSFLIMPVQRCPRYLLMLNDLIKQLKKAIAVDGDKVHIDIGPQGDRDMTTSVLVQSITKARDTLMETNRSIDDSASRAKMQEMLQKVQDSFEKGMLIVNPDRRLLSEDSVTVALLTETGGAVGDSVEATAFLFNDMVLIGRLEQGRKQGRTFSRIINHVRGRSSMSNTVTPPPMITGNNSSSNTGGKGAEIKMRSLMPPLDLSDIYFEANFHKPLACVFLNKLCRLQCSSLEDDGAGILEKTESWYLKLSQCVTDIRSMWDVEPPPPPLSVDHKPPGATPPPPTALLQALAKDKAGGERKTFPPPPGLKLGAKLDERKQNARERAGTGLMDIDEEARGQGGKGFSSSDDRGSTRGHQRRSARRRHRRKKRREKKEKRRRRKKKKKDKDKDKDKEGDHDQNQDHVKDPDDKEKKKTKRPLRRINGKRGYTSQNLPRPSKKNSSGGRPSTIGEEDEDRSGSDATFYTLSEGSGSAADGYSGYTDYSGSGYSDSESDSAWEDDYPGREDDVYDSQSSDDDPDDSEDNRLLRRQVKKKQWVRNHLVNYRIKESDKWKQWNKLSQAEKRKRRMSVVSRSVEKVDILRSRLHMEEQRLEVVEKLKALKEKAAIVAESKKVADEIKKLKLERKDMEAERKRRELEEKEKVRVAKLSLAAKKAALKENMKKLKRRARYKKLEAKIKAKRQRQLHRAQLRAEEQQRYLANGISWSRQDTAILSSSEGEGLDENDLSGSSLEVFDFSSSSDSDDLSDEEGKNVKERRVQGNPEAQRNVEETQTQRFYSLSQSKWIESKLTPFTSSPMKTRAEQRKTRGRGGDDDDAISGGGHTFPSSRGKYLSRKGLANSPTKPTKFVQNRTSGQIDAQQYYDNFQSASYGSLIHTVMKDEEMKSEAKNEANAAVLKYYGGSTVRDVVLARWFDDLGPFSPHPLFVFLCAFQTHFPPLLFSPHRVARQTNGITLQSHNSRCDSLHAARGGVTRANRRLSNVATCLIRMPQTFRKMSPR